MRLALIAHDEKKPALLRICDVHDTPLATNLTSADALIDGLVD